MHLKRFYSDHYKLAPRDFIVKSHKSKLGRKMQERPRLSSWSRYDAGQFQPSNTDHWAKRRSKEIGGPANCGAFSPIRNFPETTFDELVVDELKMPGNVPQPIRKLNREVTRTSFNEKARAGFQYWLIERPKPTTYGKYGMGSYKTVLGIGNAPRT